MKSAPSRRQARLACILSIAIAISACDRPLDYDLRGVGGGLTTADAATRVTAQPRPQPDSRGVISYPTYQVAVADRGDTLQVIADRLGVEAPRLARFNGIDPNTPLRQGEIIALPDRVPAASTPQSTTGSVDIGTLAGGAIERAGPSSTSGAVQTAALPPATTQSPQPESTKPEPVRHKVARGETAFTISRLYSVPVKALGEWNGLGPDFAIREGQYLLIPLTNTNAPAPTQAAVAAPGIGSPTPTPPSATQPLPPNDVTIPVAETPPPPPVDVGQQTEASDVARMVFPVSGAIIRDFAKGRNEGINIKADAGAPVKAADAGTVAAITKSAEGIPIIVVRHEPDLLTVYANVVDVTVEKGAAVSRGEQIATLRSGDDAYVHFEVRRGFDAVDPMPYLR